MLEHRMTVHVMGLRVRIVGSGNRVGTLIERAGAAWADTRIATEEPADLEIAIRHVSAPPRQGALTFDDESHALVMLASHITINCLTHNAERNLLFHAASVADPSNGSCAMFVGASGMGKTTAVSTLALRFGYITDEATCVSPARTVLPYRKPLSIVSGSNDLPKTQVAASQLGLMELPDLPLSLAKIFLLDRVHGVPNVSRRILPLSQGIAALTEHMSFLRSLRDPLFTLAQLIDDCGGVEVLQYSDASSLDGCDLLELRDGARPSGLACVLDLVSTTQPQPGDVVFRRTPHVDALLVNEDLVILAGDVLHRVSGLGVTIWSATAKWISMIEIMAVLGRPVSLVSDAILEHQFAAVKEMVTLGLLDQKIFSQENIPQVRPAGSAIESTSLPNIS